MFVITHFCDCRQYRMINTYKYSILVGEIGITIKATVSIIIDT